MQTITIHKAGAEDAGTIAQMAQELAAYEGQPSAANAAGIAQMLADSGEPRCECFLAKREQEAIGFVLFYTGYDLSSDCCGYHLADLYVQENWRKQGVGKQLLAAIATQARAEQRRWISLTALKENVIACEFYGALGFECVDVDFYAIGAQAMKRLL